MRHAMRSLTLKSVSLNVPSKATVAQPLFGNEANCPASGRTVAPVIIASWPCVTTPVSTKLRWPTVLVPGRAS